MSKYTYSNVYMYIFFCDICLKNFDLIRQTRYIYLHAFKNFLFG